MAQTTQEQRAAAYVAWGTFRNQLDALSKNGMPSRIDRSVFIGLSGGTQSQLVGAMKFLGLIDEEGTATDTMKELVGKDELERKEVLRRIFKEAYPELFALNLKKATPEQFLEELGRSYGVTGSTRRKAASFFLKGAEEIGIEVSPFLEKAGKVARVRTSNGGSRRRKSKKAKPAAAASPGTPGTSKTVELVSGGSLTIAADLDLFSLNAEDRKFIFSLIDKLEAYEQESAAAAEDVEDEADADDAAEEGGQQ